MSSLHWSTSPPTVSGVYAYRQRSSPELIHFCKVRIYSDGSREILGDDGDTVDNLSDYEFRGPISAVERS